MDSGAIIVIGSLCTTGGGIIGGYCQKLIAKHFDKKEDETKLKENEEKTRGIVVDQFDKLAQRLENQIKLYEGNIKDNQKEIVELKKENERCIYDRQVLNLKIEVMKKQLEKAGIPKFRQLIYVLDDQKLVTMDFQFQFDKISMFETKVYNNPELFIKDVKNDQPDIIIMDYQLGDIVADDVIKQLGYNPDIIIISASKELERRYIENGIQFFYKDENYITKVASAVLEHIKTYINRI